MFEDIAEDFCRGGYWYALRQLVIRFRWRHYLFKTQEIWLDDLPIDHEREVHSYQMSLLRVEDVSHVLCIGEYPDFIDENLWFEAVLVHGTSGFSNDELKRLDMKNIDGASERKYIMLPSSILDRVGKSPDCAVAFCSHDRRAIPRKVIIHYGKGEKPFWLEEWFIKSRTDPIYNIDDPFNPLKQHNLF